MRLLVCGGREYSDQHTVFEFLDSILDVVHVEVVIHGAARGADKLADQWAKARGIPREPFPADWTRYGNRAGRVRNQQMLDRAHPSFIVAFPGGTGTRDMVSRARAQGIKAVEVG